MSCDGQRLCGGRHVRAGGAPDESNAPKNKNVGRWVILFLGAVLSSGAGRYAASTRDD